MAIGAQVGSWTIVDGIGGGGQGTTFIATDHGGRASCLKLLDKQESSERRARFSREASCYRTVSHVGVPAFVDSNALATALNKHNELYICTELISGTTLTQLPKARLGLDQILTGIFRLIDICEELHSAGIVHRDIKPDNIIARDGDVRDLVLVDFGLAYSRDDTDGHETELGQELGNRFLRLPELQSGSRAKQDPASDLTFCLGVLFYLVTNISPRSLVDSEGKMPHQRDDALVTNLRRNDTYGFLLPIFDRGFRLRISERFQDCAELRNALRREVNGPARSVKSLDQIIAELEARGAGDARQRLSYRETIIAQVHRSAVDLANRSNGYFVRTQTGHEITPDHVRTMAGFAPSEDYGDSEYIQFLARIEGSEIVLTASDEEIYRTSADLPQLGEPLTKAIENALLVAMDSLSQRRTAKPD